MFVPGKLFQPSLVFVGKAEAYPSKAPFKWLHSGASPTNIRLGWKGLHETNTVTYYELSLITSVKSFKTLTPGANVIKLFTSVINKFS